MQNILHLISIIAASLVMIAGCSSKDESPAIQTVYKYTETSEDTLEGDILAIPYERVDALEI